MAKAALIGAREFAAELEQLTPAIQKKIMRRELRAAAKTVQQSTINLTPIGPGDVTTQTRKVLVDGKEVTRTELLKKKKPKGQHLYKNLTVRAMKRSRKRIGYRIVTKNTEFFKRPTKNGKTYFYPTIIEYGSAKWGIPPQRYMRRGMDNVAGSVIGQMKLGVKNACDEEAKRILAKTKAAR